MGWVTRGAHWVSIARDISRIYPPISPYISLHLGRAHWVSIAREIQGRYRGDTGEMQGRCREI